jgi:rhamnosyltransferase
MEQQRFYSGILFVIVVYEKSIETISSIKIITEFYKTLESTPAILVYDNSKLPQSASAPIYYLHDGLNSGVSRAYNTAANFAATLGKSRLCLLDQDTEIKSKTLESYFQSFSQFGNENVFVPKIISGRKILSPYKTFLRKGYPTSSIPTGRQATKNYQVINSGILVNVVTFKQAGGYDEHYPLDLSDNVFWKRLTRVAPTFVVTESTCEHHHSGSIDQPELAINRFEIFLKANKQFRRDAYSNFTFIPVISRGIKLSWRFKKFLFLRLAFRSLTSLS